MYVIAMVLVLSIAVVAMLSMSLNRDVVAGKLEHSTRNDHRVDGVLEEIVNDIRNDASWCDDPVPVNGYDVTCSVTVNGATRITNIQATDASATLVGRAQIKIVDEPSAGYTLEVCDWLIGHSVDEELRGCTS